MLRIIQGFWKLVFQQGKEDEMVVMTGTRKECIDCIEEVNNIEGFWEAESTLDVKKVFKSQENN